VIVTILMVVGFMQLSATTEQATKPLRPLMVGVLISQYSVNDAGERLSRVISSWFV